MRAIAVFAFLFLIALTIGGIAQAAEAGPEGSYTSAGFPFLGRSDSPVTVVEFSDFQCPFCRHFFTATFAELKRQYIDTGKVRYVFIDFPLEQMHPRARRAAEAAHCAGDQGKFWPMHDLLFGNPGQLDAPQFFAHARSIGIEEQSFDACLKSRRHSARIDRALGTGAAAGVTGTPTFLIAKSAPGDVLQWNTSIVGSQPIERFRRAIDDILAGP